MKEVVYHSFSDTIGVKTLTRNDDAFPECPIKIQYIPDPLGLVEPTKIDSAMINWFFQNAEEMREAGWEIVGDF